MTVKMFFKKNIPKAAETIMEYCNKAMKNRIKQIVDYETRVLDDPIVLLEEISAKMYDPMEEKYKFKMLTKVFKQLFEKKPYKQ